MDSYLTVILNFLISGVAIILALVRFQSDKNKDNSADRDAMDRRLDAMQTDYNRQIADYKLCCETRFTRIETRFDIFWKDFEAQMAKYLHSPHTPETDVLLEKLEAGVISPEERKMLCEKIEGHITRREYAPEVIPAAAALKAHLSVWKF